MTNSTHKVEVVPVILEKHPNADSLSIVRIFDGGYTVVVLTEDWQGTSLGAYIPPDSLVPVNKEEFAFLADKANEGDYARIKAIKLRGVVSYRMLVKLPPGDHDIGAECTEYFGVKHYEPPIRGCGNGNGGGMITGGECAKGPNLFSPKYDLEAFRKYHKLFTPGEPVYITEKIHGISSRYVFHDGDMYCGSRTEWKKEFPCYAHITMEYLREELQKRVEKVGTPVIDTDPATYVERRATIIFDRLHNKPQPKNLWWRMLEYCGIEAWCRQNPDHILYGEVFGQVQDLRYGSNEDKPLMFAAFDIMKDGSFLNAGDFLDLTTSHFDAVPVVPELAYGAPYSFDNVCILSDGPSNWPGAKHHREGCVVKPLFERRDDYFGRVALKCVGGTHLCANEEKRQEAECVETE